MPIVTDPDGMRKKIVDKLNETIQDLTKSEDVEIGIYNYSIQYAKENNIIKKWTNRFFVEIYLSKVKTIFANLNYELIHSLPEPHKVAFMTHQELNKDVWKDLLSKKEKRDEALFSTNIVPNTDITCFKCKSKQCTYTQLQTRSADESMTTYVSCHNCGNNWKFC
jgi:DNA-directed RNA polymerase subunit M/transcription elongation factor TFIIS